MARGKAGRVQANQAHQPGSPRRVLLVEDEQRLRGIVSRYLRAKGHIVTEADSATSAAAALARETFDVMLLDVNLPDSTGWDVLRRLENGDTRGQPRPCVVIVSAVPPAPSRLAQFRPDAVLNKPFPIDALERLVATGCRAEPAAGDLHVPGSVRPPDAGGD
ncbi:MAG: hypothetical protein DCC58_05960 [Chloroflexi bacterium]|nr:MAG: hypothetical protein DCC58_05960 [Chloroflexota bacterium]